MKILNLLLQEGCFRNAIGNETFKTCKSPKCIFSIYFSTDQSEII